MELFALVAGGLLPGAWIGFGVRSRGLGAIERLALSVAFSPCVAALQFTALRALGAPGRGAAFAVLLVNLPAAALAALRLREPAPPRERAEPLWILLAAAIPLAWLAAQWLSAPDLRVFGFHNLTHVDIVYGHLRPPVWPEEPQLAGTPLAYPWLTHAQWAVLGRAADWSPTQMFPAANTLALLAALTLLYRSGRELRLHPALALLAAALSVLAGHVARDGARLLGIEAPARLAELFGDLRLALPLAKFQFLDLLPDSFALLAVVVWTVLRALRTRDAGLVALGALALPALAATYAVALPAACAVVGGGLAAAALAPRSARKESLPGLLALAASAALALVGASLWVGLGAGPVARIESAAEIPAKAWHALLAVAPLLLLALPAALRAAREREPALLGLALASGALLLAYALLRARSLEYKYVLYATPLLALLAAASLDHRCRGWGGGRWALAGVLIGVAGALDFAGAAGVRSSVPSLPGAPPLREGAFQLELAPGSPHAGWTRAVRDESPADTVLVAAGLPLHAGTFANRSLYFPCEAEGWFSAGYTFRHRDHLVFFRGTPPAVFERREQLVARLHRARSRPAFLRALAAIAELGRPLALHFRASEERALAWLETLPPHYGGRLLHADGAHVVWLLDPASRAGSPRARDEPPGP